MDKMHNQSLAKTILLIGILALAHDVNAQPVISIPIQENLPKKILYLNEQDQIFMVAGNSEDVPYNRIKIFKGKKEIKMDSEIDYQYQKIKLNLSWNKKGFNIISPVTVPNVILKDGKPYSKLERDIIDALYEKNILYPNYQIAEALKKSKIRYLINGDKLQFTISPDEATGNDYGNVSFELK
jgi:hypothetical protein